MATQTDFADRLKNAMTKCGISRSSLIDKAQKQGVKLGKSQLSQYLSGKNIPRRDTLAFLAGALGVPESWLASEKGSKSTEKIEPRADLAQAGQASLDEDKPATSKSKKKGGHKHRKDSGGHVGHNVREFKKSSKLENVLYDVRGPVLDEANRMEQAGESVLKLNIGNPAPFGFRAVDEVVQDMAHQLSECEGYSDSKGLWSARKAIMQYYQLKGLANVSMEGIYTGNGVSELVNICMLALLNNGDEILIPAPDYPLWTACATLAGGTPVHYMCDEQAGWYPDLDDIRRKISSRTKAVVIINPNNPTGALYPREVLEGVAQIAREHGLMIFSDEIYDRLVMLGEGEHTSIASLAPDLFCVTFSGLSKSHMVAGYRIGWMALSGDLSIGRDYILGLNMLSNMRLCSNVPAQSIVQTALWGHQSVNDYVVPGGRIYEQRECVCRCLEEIDGVSLVKPKAAFYAFPKLDVKKFNITDDERFALDLLREKKVLVVQGSGFNWPYPDHFRIVYLPRRRELQEAVKALGDFLAHYRQ